MRQLIAASAAQEQEAGVGTVRAVDRGFGHTPDVLLTGLRRARDRIDEESKGTCPVAFAVFEALNWAVALMDRLRIENKWEPTDAGVKDLFAALRFARNRVHHDWIDAICLSRMMVEWPNPQPLPWTWRSELPSRDENANNTGKKEYEALVAGKRVAATLDALIAALSIGVSAVPHPDPN